MTGRRRWLLTALVVAVLAAMVPAGPATAGGKTTTTTDNRFSCRASLARLEGMGLLKHVGTVEPLVANRPGKPCVTDAFGVRVNALATLGTYKGNSTVLLGADVKVLYGATHLLKNTRGKPRKAMAEAAVALVRLNVLGNQVELAVLTSNAKARCAPNSNALPALSGDTKVIGLSINGIPHHDFYKSTDHWHIKLFATLAVSLDVKASFKHLYTEAELDLMLETGVTLHFNHEEIVRGTGSDGKPFGKITERTVWLETDLLGDVVLSESIADYHDNPCARTTDPPPAADQGWMTGGGRVNTQTYGPVTHGFRLECTEANGQNNLQVNWGGNHFHLEDVTTSDCGDIGSIDPGNPHADFDLLEGSGTGRCNGNPASVSYKLTDAGEPGTGDSFEVHITGGGCTLHAGNVPVANLSRGNHQAHGRM